jgi:hypothetical protein
MQQSFAGKVRAAERAGPLIGSAETGARAIRRMAWQWTHLCVKNVVRLG